MGNKEIFAAQVEEKPLATLQTKQGELSVHPTPNGAHYVALNGVKMRLGNTDNDPEFFVFQNLLALLITNQNKVVTQDDILDLIKQLAAKREGEEYEDLKGCNHLSGGNVKVHIARLRSVLQKFDEDIFITTVRGRGYTVSGTEVLIKDLVSVDTPAGIVSAFRENGQDVFTLEKPDGSEPVLVKVRSGAETRILRRMIEHPYRTFSCGGSKATSFPVQIASIRKAFKDAGAPSGMDVIQTENGVGYKLNIAPAAQPS